MAAVSVKRSIITIACEQAGHFWRVKRFARERASHFRVPVRVPFTRDFSRLFKIEFGVMFMTNVKRESVPRDQSCRLLSLPLCEHQWIDASFIHKNCFKPFLSGHFLF